MKKLAIFDLDGTLFRWQLYHELVFALKARDVFDKKTSKKLDEAFLEWQSKDRSWHDYEMEIVHALEPSLVALDPNVFDLAVAHVIKSSSHKIYSYTKKLAETLKAEDYFLLAISGSQQEIAEKFATTYGFDACIGALYERHNGHFTGSVLRRVPGRKHEIIREFLDEHTDISLENSVAIGDSGGDISMLKMVETPIAFNPSAELLDVALASDWKIIIERKNIAYTLNERKLTSIDTF